MKQFGGGKVNEEPGKPQGYEESGSVSRDIPGIGFSAYTSDWPNHTYEMNEDNLKPVAHKGFTVQAKAMAALLFDFATRPEFRAAVQKEFAHTKAQFETYLAALEQDLQGADGARPEVAATGAAAVPRFVPSSWPAATRPRACALHWRHVRCAVSPWPVVVGRRVPGPPVAPGAGPGAAPGHAPHACRIRSSRCPTGCT